MSVGATPFLRELTDTFVTAGALLPTLLLFICGGAPVAPALVRRAAQAIPGCAISRAFGSSEAPTVTLGVRGVEELELGATTDGRIVNNEVRIIDEATGALLGEIGRASCRVSVCQYVLISVFAVSCQQQTH